MADAKDAEPNPPRTLVEAHEALARIRPSRKAPLGQWLSYHQRSAAVYAEIAEINRGHHHESLYWAEHAHNRTQEIKAHISDERTIAINEEGTCSSARSAAVVRALGSTVDAAALHVASTSPA